MLRAAPAAILALASLGSGCVAVAAAGVVGVGVVQYERNEVSQDFALDLQATWKAVLEGLKRLDLAPEETALNPSEGHIVSADVVVRVERHPEGFTRVRVRVGTFHTGDHRRRGGLVLKEIAGVIERQDELRAWSEKVQGTTPAEPAPKP